MAAAETRNTPSTPDYSTKTLNSAYPSSKSFFQRTVCLRDWWLVKAEKDSDGKRLAVAGVTSRETQAVRVYYSAPILRRHDVFTLETVDGICIIINGFLDKVRTVENGFPSQVCNQFVFGFPASWETSALDCFRGEPLTSVTTPNATDPGKLPQKRGIVAPKASERLPSPEDILVRSTEHVETFRNSPCNIARQSIPPSQLDESDISDQNNEYDHQRRKDSSSPHPPGNSSACKRKIYSNNNDEEIKDYNLSFQTVRTDVNADHLGGSRSTYLLNECLRRWKDNPVVRGRPSNPQSSFPNTKGRKCKENASPNTPMDSTSSSISCLPDSGIEELGNGVLRTPDSRTTNTNSGQEYTVADKGINADNNNCLSARKSNKVLHPSRGFCKAGKGKKNGAGACKHNTSRTNICKESRKTKGSHISRKENEKSIVSPESLSLRRSRSGRLLLPRLEFWRNQMAIYDAGRQVTGVKDLQINEPSKGSRSEPKRKKTRAK